MTPQKRTPGGHRANARAHSEQLQRNYTTLADALAIHGLQLPDHVEPGKFCRFPGAEKRDGNKAGWCLIFDDGAGAAFGDWSTGLSETWQPDGVKLSAKDRRAFAKQVQQARAKAEAARKERQDAAAKEAREIWDAAEPATDHPYLQKKGVSAYGLRVKDGVLIVPMLNAAGELRSLQYIDAEGQKRFHPGGEVSGTYHQIGEPGERIIIAEGYATAASIYEATGDAAAVAFNAGNLKPVAEGMRAKYPDAQLIVAADDDRNTAGNPGVTKAREAAQAVGGLLAEPGKAGDFNDLHQAEGTAAVAERIDQAAPIRPKGFRLVRAGTLKAKEHDWLIDGLLERDSLAAFFGPPETWKSLYMIDACCSVAHGVDFHGAKVKQGNAVYVCGEGFAGLARRFKAWSIRHDVNPDDNQVMVSTQAAQLNDPETFPLVAATIADAKPDLVVIDTLARNFGPGDENATSDMTDFVAACDRIRAENGCTVALVHHSGLMDKTRGRGNSALKGALDWEYMFTRTGDVVEVQCSKVKDADRPPPQAFTLDIVIVDEAKDIRSVTLAKSEPPQPAPTTKRGKHQLKALAVLESMVDQHGENLAESGRSKDDAKVRLLDWRDECIREDIPRNRWYEVKRTLQAANEIEVTSGFVYLSGCPVS